MFEHFRQFFANERNRTAILLIIGLLIFVAVLKHFGLYEGFIASGRWNSDDKIKGGLTCT
jgi:hypothetical protein